MVLQFFENAELAFAEISDVMASGSSFSFVVFNPPYVFEGFEPRATHIEHDCPTPRATLSLGDSATELVDFPLYLRGVDQYTEAANCHKFVCIDECFISGKNSNQIPKYLVLTFKKR